MVVISSGEVIMEVTPKMIKAAWVEARRWWPKKVVEMQPCKACRQVAGLRVLETCILVDEPLLKL